MSRIHPYTKPGKVIGQGSEATVYAGDDGQTAFKMYDRLSDKRDASRRARREHLRLTGAQKALAGIPGVSAPVAGRLLLDPPGFGMQRVAGITVLEAALLGTLSDHALFELVPRICAGIRALLEEPSVSSIDATLDNIMVDVQRNEVIFIDFGQGPGQGHSSRLRETVEDALIHLIGTSIYEASRPSRVASRRSAQRLAELLAHIADDLLPDGCGLSVDSIMHLGRLEALRSMRDGSAGRRLWYAVAGSWTTRQFGARFKQTLNDLWRPGVGVPPAKILFFVWDFPFDGKQVHNGVHKAVEGLAEGIALSGVETSVMCYGREPGIHRNRRMRIESYPPLALIPSMRLSRLIARRIQVACGNTIVVLNGVFNARNCLLARRLRKEGVSYVVAPHTEFSDSLFERNALRKRIFWRWFEKPMLQHAAAIHLLDERITQDLRRRGVNTPVVVTANGVHEQAIGLADGRHPFAEASPGRTRQNAGMIDCAGASRTDSNRPPARLLYFGRIQAEAKGLRMLLEAAARVARDIPFELVLQGPDLDGERPDLEDKAARLGITHMVTFRDPDYVSDPVQLMKEFDAFVLPSRFEGFPMAGVEAMMASLPVLMTDVGGLAPLIREAGAGIVVRPNRESIEQGLLELLNRRGAWPEMGRRGHTFVRANLTWPAIGRQFLAGLEEVAHD